MSPENNNDLVEQFISVEPSGKLSHPVNQVTAVSKYLALLLFIILPFIGAYVGYRVAGERVVEVQLPLHTNDTNFDDEIIIEKELPTIPTSQSTSTKKNKSIVYFECTSVENNYPHECVSYGLSATSSPIIKNLTEEAIKQGVIRGRTAIQQEVYTTSDSSMIYFTAGIPESDGCCSLIGFDTKTLKFHKVDLYKGLSHSRFSRDQRYFVAVEDNMTIYVVDLQIEKIVQRQILKEGNLVSTKCGFAGDEYDLAFNEIKNGFDYGIFSKNTETDNQCKQEKISKGFIPIE